MSEHLIHALLLDGQGGGRNLSWEDALKWQPADGVLWLHFDYTQPETQNWIRQQSGLHYLAAEALLTEETRPRVTQVENALLIALRGVNLNPEADPEDMVSIRLWVESQRIISTRRRRLLTVSEIREEFEKGVGPRNAGSLLVHLADRLIWRMGNVVEQSEDQIDQLEDAIVESESVHIRNDLALLRRRAIMLKRYLSPQRDALNRLQTETVTWLENIDRLRLREVADRLIRHIEDLDAVRERAAVTQEELVNRLSDQLNRRMYVLSIAAAIFLPLSFLTGLLGINVGGIPLAENSWGFTICALSLLLIVVIQVLVFHKKGWL